MACVVEIEEHFDDELIAQTFGNKIWNLLLCIDISLQKNLLMLVKGDFEMLAAPISFHDNVFKLLP